MRVVSTTNLPVTSLSWQARGGITHTIVCKATYDLTPGRATLAASHDPIVERDEHVDDDDGKSLRAASDLAPFKRRADVVVVGSIYAPAGAPARRVVARIMVGDIDKSIAAYTDRTVSRDNVIQEGKAFQRMSIAWERAGGGEESDNPVGRVPTRDGMGRLVLPNLMPPAFEPQPPDFFVPSVGLGPIAATWPARLRKLGGHAALPPEALLERPEEFESSYFNVAPLDQQLDDLPSDCRITLENLHPHHAVLSTLLPGNRARAICDIASIDIELLCDTLVIDTDRSVCTLTWRGSFWGESFAADERVIVALEQPDARMTPDQMRRAIPSGESTMTLMARPRIDALPFSQRAGGATGVRSAPDLAGMPFQAARAPLGGMQLSSQAVMTSALPEPSSLQQAMVSTALAPSASNATSLLGAPSPTSTQLAPPHAAGSSKSPGTMPPPSSADASLPAMQPPPSMAPAMQAPAMQAPAIQTPGMLPPMQAPAMQAPPLQPPQLQPPPKPLPPPAMQSLGSPLPGSVASMPMSGGALPAPPPPVLRPAPPPPTAMGTPPSQVPPPSPASGSIPLAKLPAFMNAPAAPAAVVIPAHDARAASRGVASASDAAARTEPPRPPAEPNGEAKPQQKVPRGSRSFVDLLWFDPGSVERVRSQASWGDALKEPAKGSKWLTNSAALEAAKSEVEPVRFIARALTRVTPLDVAGVHREVLSGVDDDGFLVRPLVVVEGDVAMVYDPVEALNTSIALAEPLAVADKKLKETLDQAADVSKAERRSTVAMVEAALGRVRTAFASANKVYPAQFLETTTERILIEERKYQRRTVFGSPKLVATMHLQPSGSFPLYLPDSLATTLPLLPRFRGRVIAEPHPRQDMADAEGTVLLVLAIGRVVLPPAST